MTKPDDGHGYDPKMWQIRAMVCVLENPDFMHELRAGTLEIEKPAPEEEVTKELEYAEAPDLDAALAKAHELLDKHAHEAGELDGLEIYLIPPELPHADQERLGIRDYKISAEARKEARKLGIRRDIKERLSRMVRHAVPFDHPDANLRFRGIMMRVEGDTVTWVGLALPRSKPRMKLD
jgi:hypothetical protein